MYICDVINTVIEMKKYKNAGNSSIIINLLKKKVGVDIKNLTEYKKDNRDIYIVPEDSAYLADGISKLSMRIHCKNREISKKMYTCLKNEGYKIVWLDFFGGHRAFLLSKNPSDNYKIYGYYY